MSFIESIKSAYTNYCKFDGRACRSEYWFFVLFEFIVSLILSALNYLTTDGGKNGFFYILLVIFEMATLLPSLGLVWRRLHDSGRCGAWFFIWFVPVVGWILLIVWLCQDSEPGTNRYGSNPKE